jgi:hypothetical protein
MIIVRVFDYSGRVKIIEVIQLYLGDPILRRKRGNPYSLLQQVNAALAQSCQPFVAWRLEWVSGELDRLWPEGVPQIRNEHGSAFFTGYAHDEAGNRSNVAGASIWVWSDIGRCSNRSGLPSRPGSICRTTVRTMPR